MGANPLMAADICACVSCGKPTGSRIPQKIMASLYQADARTQNARARHPAHGYHNHVNIGYNGVHGFAEEAFHCTGVPFDHALGCEKFGDRAVFRKENDDCGAAKKPCNPHGTHTRSKKQGLETRRFSA
jgi:hypothetical protein